VWVEIVRCRKGNRGDQIFVNISVRFNVEENNVFPTSKPVDLLTIVIVPCLDQFCSLNLCGRHNTLVVEDSGLPDK
jgi:hypothetical protein